MFEERICADHRADANIPTRSSSKSWQVVRLLWIAYGTLLVVGSATVLASWALKRAAARPIPVIEVSDDPGAVSTAYRAMPPRPPVAEGSWIVTPAFPNLLFHELIFVIGAPRTGQLFAGELPGRILAFDNDSQTSQTTTFLDIRDRCHRWNQCGLHGVAFHPDFGRADSPNRGFIYVWYQYCDDPHAGPAPANGDRLTCNRLSRFTVPDQADVADPNSELVLIDQRDRNMWHNGGGMFFGAHDGFLYLSLGDEGGGDNEFDNAQRLDRNLFSGVIRIDVDCDPSRSHAPPRQPAHGQTAHYFIPDDNPFVGRPAALEEFWCIGLRSPHRMTQDPPTGTVWVGDAGDDGAESREEINLIRKGGNYQWDFCEGLFDRKPRPQEIPGQEQPPYYEYRRGDGNRCVIGGYVYRGMEHALDLGGKYIFGDNCSGRIWSLDFTDGKAPTAVELCCLPAKFRARTGLSSFGVDNRSELYVCVVGKSHEPTGRIFKLAHAGAPGPAIPRLLSGTGVFRDAQSLMPSPGMVPYEINVPLWSDGAEKRRWMSLPGDTTTASQQRIAVNPDGSWFFPSGTVFVKHFELPGFGPGGSPRRLETRILVRDPDESVYGVSYRWRPDQSDADLVDQGLHEDILSADSNCKQTWFFPGPADCLTCHNATAGFVLGVHGKQLNREVCRGAGGRPVNQLQVWNDLHLFEPTLSESQLSSMKMWRMAAVEEVGADVEEQVKSYLDVNCGMCHRPHEAHANFDARFDTPPQDRHIVNGRAISVAAATGQRIVTPGDLQRSLLYQRMSSESDKRMPPLARNLPDRAALQLMAQWIEKMPPDRQSDGRPAQPAPSSKPWFLRLRSLAAAWLLVTLTLAAATVMIRQSRPSTTVSTAASMS
jgi:uncharacterized repeat protein (TIGR03806 family)